MENQIIENSYREIKRKAKEQYMKIGQVWCPALEEVILFDEAGFRHLVQKGRRFRVKSEQKRRFMLLQDASKIISDPRANFSKEPHSTDPNIAYWIFRDGHTKLIVRQIGNGKKHFLSIYGKTQKPTQ